MGANEIIELEKLTSKLLETRGVHHVMVVDDSLDAGPEQWKDLLPAIQDDIRTTIEANPELESWLEQEGLALPDSGASLEAEHYLERLKARMLEREDLLAIWKGIIEPSVGSARKEVDDLIDSLEALGLVVQPSGIRDPKDPPVDVSVIFIDYTLDDTDPENLAARAIEEIERIHQSLKTPIKPIVLLMSSRTHLSPELKISFHDETNIMAGMFLGFQKEELKGTSLCVILTGIAENWPNAVALQSFIHDVSDASQAANDAVKEMVQALTLEDFSLIQLLSLNADGHPLGEYLLWLIGAYFKQRLGKNESVQLRKAGIDRMVFQAPATTDWGPSDAFLSAYRSAVFADADEDIAADRYPALSEAAKELSGQPDDIVALHFGDVFVETVDGSPRAHIVMTPECDLAFGGSRAFPREHAVVLIPGNMTPGRPFKMSGGNAARTELLRWNNEDWRVDWQFKEGQVVNLGEFREASQKRELKRVARVEFSFASDVQRAFVADLTRVGLPVVPPQFQSHEVIVFVEDWKQDLQIVFGPIRDGAYLFSSPQYSEWKCILSDDVVIELLRNLDRAMELAEVGPSPEELEKTPVSMRDDRERKANRRVKRNVENLQELCENPDSILTLKGPHDLDVSTGEKILPNVTITNKSQIAGRHAQTVLTIQLRNPADRESEVQGEDVDRLDMEA